MSGIFISRIVEGGAAHRDNTLQVGDRVITINGVDMTEARHDQAVALLTAASPTIALVVERELADTESSPGPPRSRPHSPPPPRHAGSEDQEDPDSHKPSCASSELHPPMEIEYPIEEVTLVKAGGPLGLSVVGGSDHTSHPFGVSEPGVFISKVIPRGLACKSGLRVGDRILEVNGIDLRHATHQEAVRALLSNRQEIQVLVRRDPAPSGMQEIVIEKKPGEKLGISIRGGAKGHAGNPFDATDEGVFISKVSPGGAAARDGRLRVGMRILEVNSHSLLGMTHTEAVRILRSVGDTLAVLVCDGFDPTVAATIEASPGVIANPFAACVTRKNSMDSISSIDKDLSPEELDILQKEVEMVRETSQWEKEDLEKVERMRVECEEANRLLEEEPENQSTVPIKLDYRTLAALPTVNLQKLNQFCPFITLTADMETPLQAKLIAPVEPPAAEAASHPLSSTGSHLPPQLGHMSRQPSENLEVPPHGRVPTVPSREGPPTRAIAPLVPAAGQEEEECLVDSQPICFSENPFLVANRQGKGQPPERRVLSGPPVGYGRQGQLQTCLHSKPSSTELLGSTSCSRDAPRPPSPQLASINFTSNAASRENALTKPGVIQPLARVQQRPPAASQDGQSSASAIQQGPPPVSSQASDGAPCSQHSPEQRSFRDRQKYFEMDTRQHMSDSKPKPRVSLVGEDDLKKMWEEEVRRVEQHPRECLVDEEDEEEEDLAKKQMAELKDRGRVVLDGAEYGAESASGPSASCRGPSAASPSSGKGDSDGFRPEQRPSTITGVPIRTAKAERRHQERLLTHSPELRTAAGSPDRELSPAEKRALEAEKRAMWRAARPCGLEEDVRHYEQDLAKRLYQARVRASQGEAPPAWPASAAQPSMKSLEQDALKAQVVIARSQEGKKRSALDRLAECPSPAATPSPTPPDSGSRCAASPGRSSLPQKKFDYRQFAAIPSSKPVYDLQPPDAGGYLRDTEEHSGSPAAPPTDTLEEAALYSNRQKLRQGRQSLETAVPT